MESASQYVVCGGDSVSVGDLLAGGLGLLLSLVGVVAYVLGFKAGMTRAFEAARQAVKEAFTKS